MHFSVHAIPTSAPMLFSMLGITQSQPRQGVIDYMILDRNTADNHLSDVHMDASSSGFPLVLRKKCSQLLILGSTSENQYQEPFFLPFHNTEDRMLAITSS